MNNITIYGSRNDVLDLSKRLQATIPGGRKLSQDEALSLAQLSVAHGLDPFNGEAWIIPGSGLMVGIKGLRKSARRAAKEEDSVFWTDFKLAPASDYNAPDDAVVYECYLRDTVTTQAWSKAVNIMTTAGVPYTEAAEYVGPPPVVIGVGIATPKEKSKMPIHQRAKKRAEADALKQRYDVALEADFSTEDPEVIQAEFVDDGDNGKPRPEAEIASELGYDFDDGDELPIEGAKMPIEKARGVKNSKGEKYGDLPTDKLAHMFNSLQKVIGSAVVVGEDPNMSIEDLEEKQYKMDAIQMVLADRD